VLDGHPWAAVSRLLLCLFFLLSFGCVATNNVGDDSARIAEQSFTIQGKIQKVSPEEGLLVVASPKGDRVILKLTGQTAVKGGVVKDVDKFHPVKAVYTVEDGQNRLLVLEILPQGSCSGE